MKKNLTFLILFLSLTFLFSCNKNTSDTSELWEKSTTRGDIIRRSGLETRVGTDPDRMRNQLADAENRLATGGGLFGKKPGFGFMTGSKKDKSTNIATVGMPVNPYLWKGSLETIEFMPLLSANPLSGIIITDWYSISNDTKERCKLNIFIKGIELESNNLKVNTFCQKLSQNNNWIDQVVNIENNIKLENAILNKAKKIRLSKG